MRLLHSVGERLDFTHDRLREGGIQPDPRATPHVFTAVWLRRSRPSTRGIWRRTTLLSVSTTPRARFGTRPSSISAGPGPEPSNARPIGKRLRALSAPSPRWRISRTVAVTLEQAFEIRLELRPALSLLGEVLRMRERLREAEALAERLNDDRRRGRVCAFVTNSHSLFGELDEALANRHTCRGDRPSASETWRLRILTTTISIFSITTGANTSGWSQPSIYNLAALPADWIYENFGNAAPASVYDRSLAGPEPRRAWQIRPAGRVPSRGDSARRARRIMRSPSVWPTAPRARSTSSRATGRRRAH